VDPNVPGPRVAAATFLSVYNATSKDATRMRWGAAAPRRCGPARTQRRNPHGAMSMLDLLLGLAERHVRLLRARPNRSDEIRAMVLGPSSDPGDVHVSHERIREAAPFSREERHAPRIQEQGHERAHHRNSLGLKTLLQY
jgi:hypothetical protein